MLELHASDQSCEEGLLKYLLFAKHGVRREKLEIYSVTIDKLSEANSSLKRLYSLTANDFMCKLTKIQIIAGPSYVYFWMVTRERKGEEAKIEMQSLHKSTHNLQVVPDQTFRVPPSELLWVEYIKEVTQLNYLVDSDAWYQNQTQLFAIMSSSFTDCSTELRRSCCP